MIYITDAVIKYKGNSNIDVIVYGMRNMKLISEGFTSVIQ